MASSVIAARLALGWLIGGEWRAHPARFLMTAIAIAVGVALGFAVHLVNQSALSSFAGAIASINGDADFRVRATSPLGFDEALYPRIAAIAGVADLSPVVALSARVGEAKFMLLGLDVIRAAGVTPSLIGMVPRGLDGPRDAAFAGDALFLSASAMRDAKAKVGDSITVSAGGKTARLRVAGGLPGASDGQATGVIDIASAQWRFGRLGRLDRIDIKHVDGEQPDAAIAAIAAALPANAVIDTDASANTRSDALSRAYRVNLTMLALVALLTGGFLVYSAQSLSVARRLRSFALVRTLGLPRSGIVAAVAIEGVLIGTIGSALGLAAGYGLAALALAQFGGDLGAGYFSSGAARLAIDWVAAAGFFALGLSIAVLGSALPARLAARAAPAVALRNAGDLVDPRAPVAWVPALVLVTLGIAAAFSPSIAGLPVLGFVSVALILAGGIVGMPWLARSLLAPLASARDWRVPFDLAVRHLHGAPGGAATALCGIVASTALMIAMAVMVTSFRSAVDDWLGQVLSADLYLRIEGGAGFDGAAQTELAATPGVKSIAFTRQIPLTMAPDRPPLWLIARPDPQADATLIKLGTATLPDNGALPVWISEPAARLYGWQLGQTITLPVTSGAATRFAVVGIWRDYARQQGAVAIDARHYTAITGDSARGEGGVILSPGADPQSVGQSLIDRSPAAVRAQVEVAEPARLRAFALTLFDRSFAVTYLLEGVAILVGLAGVAATMSAQTLARAREFGMLRHIGVARRQITAMLAIEGALLGAVGAAAGITLGLGLAQVLVHVINPQSFNWTMDTRVPWGSLGIIAVALVAAAGGTAVMAGRQALSESAVRMVREDW